MDPLTVTFVTACTAFVSAAAGPFVSVVLSSRQMRSSLIAGNRERWLEALRDSLAEYVGLALRAAAMQEARQRDTIEAIRVDPEAGQLVERVALVKNRILLMVNPLEAAHQRLCIQLLQAYDQLVEHRGSIAAMSPVVDAIVEAGRVVLKAEWSRVKRGD